MSENIEVKHYLTIKYQDVNQQIALTNDVYSIGRHSSNKIVINNETISRFHCTILPVKYQGKNQQDLFWIIDGDLQGNRSSNGLFINSNRCLSHELKSGDIIKIGGNEVEISYLVCDLDTYRQIADLEDNIINANITLNDEENSYEQLKTTVIDKKKNQEEFFVNELLFALRDKKLNLKIPYFKVNLNEQILFANEHFQQIFSTLVSENGSNPFNRELIVNIEDNQTNIFIRDIEYQNHIYTQYSRLDEEHNYIESYIFSFQEKQQVERQLRDSEEKYRAIVRQISEGIILVDPTTKQIIEANSAYCSLMGYTNEEITCLKIYDLIATDPDINDRIIEDIKLDSVNVTQESVHRHLNGSFVNVEINISSIYYGAKQFICYAVRDVTQRKQAEDMLRYQAGHDLLTELANRKLFNERLKEAIFEKRNSQERLGVIFVDLDRFKNINDTLGHDVGDLFLQQVASKIKNCLNHQGLVARWGGDEFTILLSSVSNRRDLDAIAFKLLDTFKQPLQVLDFQLYCHLSMGIAVYPEHGTNPETLLKNADIALYRSKDQGGNHFQYYVPSMNERKKELLELESYLYEAIRFNQFELHYQPQINVQTGEIIGMEALIRWQHPSLGTVPPSEFIPLAEESGFINSIGEWALLEACKQNKQWQDLGLPKFKIAVNLSARQFRMELPTIIERILKETKLEARYLELEITENSIIVHPELTRNILQELNKLGIAISMDDFGTGYSSLGYLKKFPFDKIKIDQSFVQELKNEPQDLAIISAVITLGKGFNLNVVAEGIETLNQLRLLTSLQCDCMQGFLFSHPLPADQTTYFIQSFVHNGLNSCVLS